MSENSHLMSFGGLLRHYRTQRGMTLRELGTLSSLDHAYIHRLETGAKTSPSATAVRALSQALNLAQLEADALMWQSLFSIVKAYKEKGEGIDIESQQRPTRQTK